MATATPSAYGAQQARPAMGGGAAAAAAAMAARISARTPAVSQPRPQAGVGANTTAAARQQMMGARGGMGGMGGMGGGGGRGGMGGGMGAMAQPPRGMDKRAQKSWKQAQKKARDAIPFDDIGNIALDDPESMSAEVRAWREKNEMTVAGGCPDPFFTFEQAPIPPAILRKIAEVGFTAPSLIQAQSWPVVLQGRDVVGVAKTGSGKTLGFLMPGFNHILKNPVNVRAGPQILVLAPTRELACQIQVSSLFFSFPADI